MKAVAGRWAAGPGRVVAVAVAATLTATAPVQAQARRAAAGQAQDTAPSAVLERFHDGVRALRWDVIVSTLHPGALASYRSTVDGYVGSRLGPTVLSRWIEADRAAYAEMADEEVLRRVFRGLGRDAPGLVHALVSRPTRVLGSVQEGSDTAHVVYRLEPGLVGEPSEVKVATVVRDPAGAWKVRESAVVEALRTSLNGVLRTAPGAPPGGG